MTASPAEVGSTNKIDVTEIKPLISKARIMIVTAYNGRPEYYTVSFVFPFAVSKRNC